jgi:hypothetical protein
MRIDVGFPFRTDDSGRLYDPAYEEHVRQLIEQLLFTAHGERVNRPDLGAGLLELLFAPASSEVISVAEHQVAGSLNRWLGELIQVESVRVGSEVSRLRIEVLYILRRNQQHQAAVFEHTGFP